MTMTVKCSSCQIGLKVTAQHAGKQVKCPKCGQTVSVPAAGGLPAWVAPAPAASSPPKAAPTNPVRASPAPAPVPRTPARPTLPLLSFEELKVPSRLRRSIEAAVGSETIVWMDRPRPESLLSKAKIGMWVGLVLSALIIGGVVFGLQQAKESMVSWIILGIGGLMFLSMGLPMATMPLWVRKL